MPLPEPLKSGASKKKKQQVVSETMHDLKGGSHHKDRTHKQEVAIAVKQSGQGKPTDPKAGHSQAMKRDKANKRKRNKGRS